MVFRLQHLSLMYQCLTINSTINLFMYVYCIVYTVQIFYFFEGQQKYCMIVVYDVFPFILFSLFLS